MRIVRKLVFWSVAVVFPLPLVLTYYSSAREPDGLKLIIVLGLTAYAWWLLAILLSVRPSWLDRLVGLPAVYGLHGMLGLLAVVLAYLHRDNSYSGDRLATLLGDWSFYGALTVLSFAMFFLSGWLVDRVRLLMMAKRLLERAFRHQLSVWVHRLNLLIVAMIWLHAHLLVRVNQYLGSMLLLDLYTVTVLGLYAWKKWIATDGYPVGTVVSNEARGKSNRRMSVELDHTAEKTRPGDFFFLRFEGSSVVNREWHPFSVTDHDPKRVSFTISQQGDFTQQLDDVDLGSRVRLEGPFGSFQSIVEEQDAETPLVFLGMGAGVAPLLSLAAAHHATREIHLLWAVRHPEEAYYRDLIQEYQTASGDLMRVTINVGRFRHGDLMRVLPEQTRATGAFFIVGPNSAVLATQRQLRSLGVPARRVHHERLTM